MTTLRHLLVVPTFSPANQITGAQLTRYLESDGYRRTLQGTVSELPAATQAAFVAVVAHAQALRTPDERIAQVFGELTGQAPSLLHTEPDPDTGEPRTVIDAYRPRISLAITLRRLDNSGERTMTVETESLPADAREAVLALWAALAAP
jgi:hypothetical protein